MPGIARLRALATAALTAALLVSVAPAVPSGPRAAAAAPATTAPAAGWATDASKVVGIATSKVGARYVYGTTGPSTFDCSGLVIYAFRKAGFGALVGDGKYRSAAALYRWFRSRGLAGRTDPQVGDIVVWGGGRHVGIYVGKGRAVSALLNGVRVHGVSAVVDRFSAYLHTGLSNTVPELRRAQVFLNLRVGPALSRAVIRVLPPRMLVTVLGRRRDARGRTWLQVAVGPKRGWVAAWLTSRP